MTARLSLNATCRADGRSERLRSFLARFLFFGEDIEKKVRTCQAGKGRLAWQSYLLAKDVPRPRRATINLDIPAARSVESALDEYLAHHYHGYPMIPSPLPRPAWTRILRSNSLRLPRLHGNYHEFTSGRETPRHRGTETRELRSPYREAKRRGFVLRSRMGGKFIKEPAPLLAIAYLRIVETPRRSKAGPDEPSSELNSPVSWPP